MQLNYKAVLFLISALFIIYVPIRTSTQAKENQGKEIFTMQEKINVGYMFYYIYLACWSNTLRPYSSFNKRPDAKYLFIALGTQNHDTQPRTLPPFKLIDENGNEYDASPNAIYVENALSFFENLNPKVDKAGWILFDVPETRTYKLKVSGGYWSSEDAFVQLSTQTMAQCQKELKKKK